MVRVYIGYRRHSLLLRMYCMMAIMGQCRFGGKKRGWRHIAKIEREREREREREGEREKERERERETVREKEGSMENLSLYRTPHQPTDFVLMACLNASLWVCSVRFLSGC
jgi:hypothetical protein